MPRAWRIVREKQARSAMDGEGARLFGGRWNSRGTRMVYASASLSLAALETLVHLNPPTFLRYVALPIDFKEGLLEVLKLSDLPSDWTRRPPSPSTQVIGDHWVMEARSAVLEVPSVIIPGERNYLLNLAHPDFPRIRVGSPTPFAFDPRLV
jgi:RES domain-containing protein